MHWFVAFLDILFLCLSNLTVNCCCQYMGSPKVKMIVCMGPSGLCIFMFRPSRKKLGTGQPQETFAFSGDWTQSAH